MAAKDELFFPAIDVNDCVTKPRLDNVYGRCDSLSDDSMCATDVMIGVKRVLAYMEGLQVTDIESVVLVMDSMVSSTGNVSSETENPLEFLTSLIVLSQICRYEIFNICCVPLPDMEETVTDTNETKTKTNVPKEPNDCSSVQERKVRL